ncbi:MAG: hypothetical protein JKX84_01230 [Flavobacteriales bacterium]|nr:hypothetical protein [Flavobacteriales bacterium]
MGAVELKGTISRLLHNVNDERFLKSVLVMLKEYGADESSLSKDQITELGMRVKRYDEGKTQTRSWKTSLKAIKGELRK